MAFTKWENLTAQVPVAWMGQEGAVAYRPAACDQAWHDAIAQGATHKDALKPILTWVDIEQDGTNISPKPDDRAGWAALIDTWPPSFARAVFQAIDEDLFPTKKH